MEILKLVFLKKYFLCTDSEQCVMGEEQYGRSCSNHQYIEGYKVLKNQRCCIGYNYICLHAFCISTIDCLSRGDISVYLIRWMELMK